MFCFSASMWFIYLGTRHWLPWNKWIVRLDECLDDVYLCERRLRDRAARDVYLSTLFLRSKMKSAAIFVLSILLVSAWFLFPISCTKQLSLGRLDCPWVETFPFWGFPDPSLSTNRWWPARRVSDCGRWWECINTFSFCGQCQRGFT